MSYLAKYCEGKCREGGKIAGGGVSNVRRDKSRGLVLECS